MSSTPENLNEVEIRPVVIEQLILARGWYKFVEQRGLPVGQERFYPNFARGLRELDELLQHLRAAAGRTLHVRNHRDRLTMHLLSEQVGMLAAAISLYVDDRIITARRMLDEYGVMVGTLATAHGTVPLFASNYSAANLSTDIKSLHRDLFAVVRDAKKPR